MAALRLLAVTLVLALGLARVSAVEVHTSPEVIVVNGTEAELECTFTSTEVISSAASVTWSFQAQGSHSAESFLYYSNGKAYPRKDVRFQERISWAGDLKKKDASISIANVQFHDNGTYFCDVKNPPDIVVTPGEIRLSVVERIASTSPLLKIVPQDIQTIPLESSVEETSALEIPPPSLDAVMKLQKRILMHLKRIEEEQRSLYQRQIKTEEKLEEVVRRIHGLPPDHPLEGEGENASASRSL